MIVWGECMWWMQVRIMTHVGKWRDVSVKERVLRGGGMDTEGLMWGSMCEISVNDVETVSRFDC